MPILGINTPISGIFALISADIQQFLQIYSKYPQIYRNKGICRVYTAKCNNNRESTLSTSFTTFGGNNGNFRIFPFLSESQQKKEGKERNKGFNVIANNTSLFRH